MNNYEKYCSKCGEEIGGRPYYIIKLDCIYDGHGTSACKSVIVCSNCHKDLINWLNVRE